MVDLIPLLGVAAVAGVLALAVVVQRAGRGRPQARLLVLLLILEASFLLHVPLLAFGTQPPVWVEALAAFSFGVSTGAVPWLYLAFLSHLETPLTRPFLGRGRILVALALGASSVVTVAMAAEAFGVVEGSEFLLLPFLAVYVSALVFAVIASLSAWRRALVGTPARARARAFALAFVTRDTFFVLAIAASLGLNATGLTVLGLDATRAPPFLGAVGGLLYALLLAYGILRTQLFDLDVRMRRGISRGTLAASFVVVYLVASQAARLLVEPAWGPWLGLVAAALLVLALSPLQGLAERFAAALVPTSSSDARRLEVFESAVADAYAQGRGELSSEDREFLSALARDLGITPRERDFLQRRPRTGTRSNDPLAQLVAAGRFRPIVELGEGAYGRAVLARDTILERDVVLKLLRNAGGDPDEVLREARALARLRHPNVLAIHDAGRVEDRAYLVVEHAPDGSLAERLAQGALPPAAFARLAEGLLSGLSAVHASGLLHRDIKPSNVLLVGEEPKLADFGVAHVPGFDATLGPEEVGTLRYLAPEQARGAPATVASDLYAAAATLFEAVAGRPFLQVGPGERAVDVRSRLRAGVPYPASGCGRPEFDPWLRQALSPEPEARYPSAAAMRQALVAPA